MKFILLIILFLCLKLAGSVKSLDDRFVNCKIIELEEVIKNNSLNYIDTLGYYYLANTNHGFVTLYIKFGDTTLTDFHKLKINKKYRLNLKFLSWFSNNGEPKFKVDNAIMIGNKINGKVNPVLFNKNKYLDLEYYQKEELWKDSVTLIYEPQNVIYNYVHDSLIVE